jgi:hypothetical protein
MISKEEFDAIVNGQQPQQPLPAPAPLLRFFNGWESADGRAQMTSGVVYLTHVYDQNGNPIPRLVTQKQELSMLPLPDGMQG